MVCSSSPCIIQGMRRDREYEYTVLPANDCGSPSGCTGSTVAFALGEFGSAVCIYTHSTSESSKFELCRHQ